MMADLVALILKFIVMISTPDYTIMPVEQKVNRLLSLVGEVNIPVDVDQVRAEVTGFLQI